MSDKPIIMIDTNCINARQKDEDLNVLEKLFHRKKIDIQKSDVLDTELVGKDFFKRKGLFYTEAHGIAVVDHSRLGHTTLATPEEKERLENIKKVLWGRTKGCSKQEIRDAMNLFTACKYYVDYFVTNEKALLSKSDNFNNIICTPRECILRLRKEKGIIA